MKIHPAGEIDPAPGWNMGTLIQLNDDRFFINIGYSESGLVERYREILGVDLHVLSWCLFEDDDQIPTTMRGVRLKLAQA
jgi:hypothetical protein